MNEHKGKFYNQAATTNYFNDVNCSLQNYYNQALQHSGAQSAIVALAEYQGESADATKGMISTAESPLLQAILLLQKDLMELQADIQKKFATEVDSAADANLEYDVIEQIESDFKALSAEFEANCKGVEALSERCQKYNKYHHFSEVDFDDSLSAFDNFCGGKTAEGYLSEVKAKLVKFDSDVVSMILERDLASRIDELDSVVTRTTTYVSSPTYLGGPDAQQAKILKFNYVGLKNQYHLTDDEIDYLKRKYPVLLSQLDAARRYSTADSDVIYKIIKEKLIYIDLIAECNLTDEQMQYVLNMEKLIGMSKKYTEKRVGELQVTAATLLAQGYTPEFISGVLGNILHEGGVANVENAAYKDGTEPYYLRDILKAGYTDFKQEHKGFDNFLYSNVSYVEYVNFLNEYMGPKDKRKDKAVWGLGQCQWTYSSRLEKLLEMYENYDSNKDGDLAYDEAMRAENAMLVYELTDSKSAYNTVDDHFDVNAISENPANNYELVRSGALYFRQKYEQSASPEPERGDSAVQIYKIMIGD